MNAKPRPLRPRTLPVWVPRIVRRRIETAPSSKGAPFGTVLDIGAERHPDRLIVTDRPPDIEPTRPTTIDYAGWAEAVSRCAGWLHAAGVERSDTVAIMKANHPDVLDLTIATARLGALPAELAWTFPPDTARTLLRRLDRPVLVTDRERLRSCALDEETLRRLTKRTIVVDGDGDDVETDDGHVIALDRFRDAPPAPARPRRMDEPLVINHTSGTTGIPKLAVISGEMVKRISRYELRQMPVVRIAHSDTFVMCAPYFHGRVLTGIIASTEIGPKLVFLSDPDPARVAPMLAAHRPTILETVPNVFIAWEGMVDASPELFGRVRVYFNTYDAIHARTVHKLLGASRRRLPIWLQGYGQSETGPVTIALYTRRSVAPERARPATQGRGLPVGPETHIRAVDPTTGKPLPTGQPGLLELRRKVCDDYAGERERYTSKNVDGWWNLGDIGTIDRLGRVRVLDREVDAIDGGSCISLEDRLLSRLPELSEVIVLAVRDSDPVPVIATRSGQPVAPERWERATRDLGALTAPVLIDWNDFPRTATWKVRRPMLRDQVLPDTAPTGTGVWT